MDIVGSNKSKSAPNCGSGWIFRCVAAQTNQMGRDTGSTGLTGSNWLGWKETELQCKTETATERQPQHFAGRRWLLAVWEGCGRDADGLRMGCSAEW